MVLPNRPIRLSRLIVPGKFGIYRNGNGPAGQSTGVDWSALWSEPATQRPKDKESLLKSKANHPPESRSLRSFPVATPTIASCDRALRKVFAIFIRHNFR